MRINIALILNGISNLFILFNFICGLFVNFWQLLENKYGISIEVQFLLFFIFPLIPVLITDNIDQNMFIDE